MMAFWAVATLLIALAALLVLWPLLRKGSGLESSDKGTDISKHDENVANFRDQLKDLERQRNSGHLTDAEAGKLKAELEKKLVDELEHTEGSIIYTNRKTAGLAWMLALFIPVVAVLSYMKLGAQTELKVQEAIFSGAGQKNLQYILEDWVSEQPKNDKALYLLGSHYMETGQLDDAVEVYRNLFMLSNGHPQVAAELAQALFLKADNVISAEVRKLYQRSLRGSENNTTALGLKGIDAFSSENYTGAIVAWEQAMQNESDPRARQSLSQGIAKARELMGEINPEVAAQAPVQLKVTIELNPELASLPASTRVVVFARPAGTRQPPIVAIPMMVGELPKDIMLDDSSAMMMGGPPLSSYEALDIVARISLSGDVMKADYQVEAKGIKTKGADPVNLVISPAG